MKRMTLCGGAVALGALMCSAFVLLGSSSSSASVREGAESLNLKPLLLTVAQVPAGWTVDASTSSAKIADRCPSPQGLTKTQNVTASFTGGRDQEVVEILTTYSIAVEKAYQKVLVPLNRCDHEKVLVSHDRSVTAAFRRMSLPTFGNQSEAFDARAKAHGATTSMYDVVIRSGNIVVTMVERSTGHPGWQQIEHFAKLALSNLPFGGTPPVSNAVVATTTTTTVPPTTTTTSPPPVTTTTRPPPPATTTTTAAPPPVPTPVTSAPAGCTPLTDGGNCYEPGEFCRDDDHGVTGRAGDGETITCEDNDGWRWEPT